MGLRRGGLPRLSAREAEASVGASACLGAGYTPHGAAIDPARLARGLADVVEGLGVPIHERTPVTCLEPHVVRTAARSVRAPFVVRATEAFTPSSPATSARGPGLLADDRHGAAPRGLLGRGGDASRPEVFGDFRFLIFYAQRTDDGRIAIGGRGAPYHFGSRLTRSFEREPAVRDHLRRLLGELFPAIGERRSPTPGAGRSRRPRLVHLGRAGPRPVWPGPAPTSATASSTTNLAGRTLADLILGEDTELTRLPWVNHRSKPLGARAAALARA